MNKKKTPTQVPLPVCSICPPGQGLPLSTTKNTYKYPRCRTGDVEAGGGRRVAQTRCNRHDNINKIKRPSQPPQAWLSACSIRPRGNVHLVPPQQIPINTQDAAHPMWRREVAGLGHRHDAAGNARHSTLTHNKHCCKHAVSAPGARPTSFYHDKYR